MEATYRRVALLGVVVALLGASVGTAGARPFGFGAGTPVIVVSDASTVEGNGGASTLVFTVQVFGPLRGSTSVAFATADTTAVAPGDYTARTGSLAFDKRNKTRKVAIDVAGDVFDEADETMQLRLAAAAGAAIGDGTAIGTIVDDDGVAPPVIAAAGDIACDPASSGYNGGLGSGLTCRQQATSDLLVGAGYTAVLLLGDNQYESGTISAYRASYDTSWGRLKTITRPAAGNHEYYTPGASGYYQYFGAAAGDPAKGWYSYDLGAWHLVALNSNCNAVGGCAAGSAQEQWLRADLAANTESCTLAYWHHPRFSSGTHGDNPALQALWQALYEANADLVLGGHDHDYERFAPQTPSGVLDQARGLREFVAGMGGKGLRGFATTRANSQARDATSLGVLELTLRPGAYDWRYRAAVGSFADSGSAACH